MPDRDNTYSTNQIKKISQCHSSFGKRTRLASPKLDRWKDLNNAIIDWQNNDALDETSIKVAEENNFQFYDTIQKKILSDLFLRFRTIYPKRNSKFNHEYLVKQAVKEIDGEEYGLTTHFAYEFEDENHYEYIKLKTAHDPEPELIDRAIITKFKNDNEEFYTAHPAACAGRRAGAAARPRQLAPIQRRLRCLPGPAARRAGPGALRAGAAGRTQPEDAGVPAAHAPGPAGPRCRAHRAAQRCAQRRRAAQGVAGLRALCRCAGALAAAGRAEQPARPRFAAGAGDPAAPVPGRAAAGVARRAPAGRRRPDASA